MNPKALFYFLPMLAIPLTSSHAETRLLAQPTVGETHIAFVYDSSLWRVDREGGDAVRLTGGDGRERNPVYSPDGRWLAFSADYAGQTDVYVMPAVGGEVRRLTWHAGEDIVRGFTPDSASVLFESPRSVHTMQLRQLYTVSIDEGVPERVPVPSGHKGAFSPDGRYLAYTPLADVFYQWKHYRGGLMSRIWIMDLADYSVTEVPKPDSGSNDTDPMWSKRGLYFNSDRDGEFNLFRFDPTNGSVTRLTDLEEFPVLSPSMSPNGTIVFEYGGRLHSMDTESGNLRRLTITARSDLPETRSRLVSDAKWVRAAGPAPDLKRVAFEYRGEIVTVPTEKGDPRVLTRKSGVHNRSPAWSPDGRQIAWFTDEGGEYILRVMSQDGRGEPRDYALEGAGFYERPNWSPDGKHIVYQDNSRSLWVIELDQGRTTEIASEPVHGPLDLMRFAWSPDSRWLAYTIQHHGLISTVYVWSVEDSKSIQLTDGLSEMASPVFDPNGQHLYVLASTDAGPLKDWFSQASRDMRKTYGIYAITLTADGPNPLPLEIDEVSVRENENAEKDIDEENDVPDVVTQIDLEGLTDRITALPVGVENRRNLTVGESGQLFWIESSGQFSLDAYFAPGKLKRFSLKDRETKTLARDVKDFHLSRDGKRILYRVKDDWFVTDIVDELPKGKGKLALDRVQVRLEPRDEWGQIFHEAWRINRDYFYDPNFHGADWEAVRDKYFEFLPHVVTRRDLDRVLQWMLSELAVSHSFIFPGDNPEPRRKEMAGLLGADFETGEGRWRFKKVYGGLNWNPELKSPLRTSGARVEPGEFLLAIDGQLVRPPDSPYKYLAGMRDRQVVLTVGARADGSDSREISVVPVGDETGLRYLDWVESNMRHVHERTSGKVAYVHVPDTAQTGHEMFKRYFYPQSHKEALIIDARHNNGGQKPDYYIDILRREYLFHWHSRHGADLRSPRAAVLGPKVMLADETAGSGGDLVVWMFKHAELGPVIGKTTFGGEVGVLGNPVLRDGGWVSAPNWAFWTEQEGFGIENVGVPPDIEVEQWPAEVNAGRDPQLDRAIEEALRLLEENPPPAPMRPDYPVRVR